MNRQSEQSEQSEQAERSERSESAEDPSGRWRMAFVHVADACWNFFGYHLQSLARQAGVAYADLPVAGAAQQYAEIDRLLGEGIEVLVFRAMFRDDAVLLALLERARRRGVRLIAVDGSPGGEVEVCSVSADNFRGQAALAEHLFSRLGGRGKIAYLQGDLRSDAGRLRNEGLLSVLRRFPQVQLVYSAAFDWSETTLNYAQGIEIIGNALDAHPDLDAIVSATDDGALGADAVLVRRGLRDRVLVTGFDAMPAGICAVHDGRIAVTARQPLDSMAQSAFDLARDLVDGRLEGVAHRLLAVDLVTRESVGGAALRALRVFPRIVADRNERMIAQQRSAAFLETLLDAMPTMICVKEPDGLRYVRSNRAREAWFGVAHGALVGKSDGDFYPAELAAQHEAQEREVLRGGATLELAETERSRRDGELHYLETRRIAIRDADGRPDCLLLLSEDVTAQTQARQQLAERTAQLERTRVALRKNHERLVEAEKMAALGALVAGVSHELNTPIGNALMAVSTYADETRALAAALAAGLKRSALASYLADAGQGIDLLERNLRRAGQLIGSFKQVAVDHGSSQAREFSLATVVRETLLTLGPTIKKTPYVVREEIPADLVLDSYPGALEQVLINLINNALIHGFAGREQGTIVLAARAVDAATVELTVRDDGVGIPADVQGRIYDPFFSTRFGQGGSGLGLGIVNQRVRGVLGGQIEVSSVPGQGTQFTLTLPRRAPGANDG